jgi:UDP-3-O-[3-hydroxymyristoyl] glucosamine N-acyltransferase
MKARIVSLSTQELAGSLQASLHGDSSMTITGLTPAHSPQASHLTFIKKRSPTAAWRTLIKLPEMAVLVEPALLPDSEALRSLRCTLLVVPSAHRSFVESMSYFYESEPIPTGIHSTAIIDPTAHVADGVSIGAFCVVGAGVQLKSDAILHSSVTVGRDVSVGARTELHSGVVIREGCIVGSDCVIHNNSVIGADGFGYISDPATGIRKVPQVGIVSVGDNVEIGANTSIDRATIGVTLIGTHTKIDNQVQIGHNVVIGKHCIICAQVGIAGSTTLGDGVVLGGGTGVADHVTIVSGVRVGGHAGVTTDILEPGDYLGIPAIKAGMHRRQQASLKRLCKRKG